MESLLNCWLSWYLELHGLSFRSLEECFRLRSILLALFSARVDKWHKQSGISLNLRTGPADHATLFNQWEGALVFINKQIKTSPQWSKIFVSLILPCPAGMLFTKRNENSTWYKPFMKRLPLTFLIDWHLLNQPTKITSVAYFFGM